MSLTGNPNDPKSPALDTPPSVTLKQLRSDFALYTWSLTEYKLRKHARYKNFSDIERLEYQLLAVFEAALFAIENPDATEINQAKTKMKLRREQWKEIKRIRKENDNDDRRS